MQSPAAVRSLRLLPSARTCLLPLSRASTTLFKPGDPAIRSEDRQGEDADEAAKSAAAEAEQQAHPQQKPEDRGRTNDPTSPVKSPPFASSPNLKSAAVGPAAEPNFQQKRHLSRAAPPLDDVACVGFDGSPLDGRQKLEELVSGEDGDDDEYYYREHKASPLSEIEFADTRLPISRARDGEKRDDLWGGEGRGYVIEDTVDDSLRRAEHIFRENRERGDPSMPHTRALMRKLKEVYESEMNWVIEY